MTVTDSELLVKVKTGLGITGDYQDETIKFYIDEVKSFMISSGVKKEVADSELSVGCIMRGVADLWNFGSGSIKFSDYFIQRVIQLSKEEAGGNTNVQTIQC